jgi:saccharopine dehydrogenase-like NADP-dependent oxidoreductase
MKTGKPRQVYIYQVADNETTMKELGVQAVVAQTAFNVVIAWELIHEGQWRGQGVFGPEAFDPLPFMDRMAGYGFPYRIKEIKI